MSLPVSHLGFLHSDLTVTTSGARLACQYQRSRSQVERNLLRLETHQALRLIQFQILETVGREMTKFGWWEQCSI